MFFHKNAILEGCLNDSDRIFIVLIQGDFLIYQVICFSLLWSELAAKSQADNHDTDDEVAPETSDHTHESSQVSAWIEITIAYCGHRDDDAPHCIPNVTPILAIVDHGLIGSIQIIIRELLEFYLQLGCSHRISKYQNTYQNSNQKYSKWPLFELTLDRERSASGCMTYSLAYVLSLFIVPVAVASEYSPK